MTGGCSFKIEGNQIGLGFTNPVTGCFKIALIKGNAQDAYHATEDGLKK